MNRLTARDCNNRPYVINKDFRTDRKINGYDDGYIDILNRLCELEDKLESGLLIELPCLRDKPILYYHGEPIYRKELNYMTKDKTICSETFNEDEFDEAEVRLKELRGE